MVVPALLECLLIWRSHGLELFLAGGKYVESIIDTLRNVLQDRRRVVGLSLDVHWNTVGFCEDLVGTVSYVQSHIKEIHDIFINLNFYLETMISEYFLDFLLHGIGLLGGVPAVTEPVITVSSQVDTEILEYVS